MRSWTEILEQRSWDKLLGRPTRVSLYELEAANLYESFYPDGTPPLKTYIRAGIYIDPKEYHIDPHPSYRFRIPVHQNSKLHFLKAGYFIIHVKFFENPL